MSLTLEEETMPQTFIYVIAFVMCALAQLFYPEATRILHVLECVCLLGIVGFGVLETYQDIQKARRAKAEFSAKHHKDSSPVARP